MERNLEEADPVFLNIYLQVHIMFMRYMDKRSPVIDRGIKIERVEEELRLELEPGLDLMGILDLVYYDKGDIVLRDHKTGASAAAHSDAKMEVQDQLLFYACLYWQIHDVIPSIELSWISSKTDYKKVPEYDQLFRRFRRKLTLEELTGFWTYIQEYVYHMRSVTPIRKVQSQCATCQFHDPCIMSLRGLNVDHIIENRYHKVTRDYEFTKFTQISSEHTDFHVTLKESNITLIG